MSGDLHGADMLLLKADCRCAYKLSEQILEGRR